MSTASRRATTHRGRRAIKSRESKVIEPPKRILVVKGHATSQVISDVLGDIATLMRPQSHKLSRKNPDIFPFEMGKEADLERLAGKFDCSLVAFGSHTKKRPNNLVLGRFFDGHILDLIELGVQNFSPLASFKTRKPALESKPCMVFIGEQFENDDKFREFKNLFIDMFRGEEVREVNLVLIDHAYIISVDASGVIHFRHYTITLKKPPASAPDQRLPKVEIEETGPSMDLIMRRTQFASEHLAKAALKRPRRPGLPTEGGVVAKKHKNISWDRGLGDTTGQIHLGRQDLSELVLRKPKALKKSKEGSLAGLDEMELGSESADEDAMSEDSE